jgi:hypothetical protein
MEGRGSERKEFDVPLVRGIDRVHKNVAASTAIEQHPLQQDRPSFAIELVSFERDSRLQSASEIRERAHLVARKPLRSMRAASPPPTLVVV